MSKRPLLYIASVTIIMISVAAYVLLTHKSVGAPGQQTTQSVSSPSKTSDSEYDAALSQISTTGSVYWIVNKKRPVPADYKPPDLAVPSVRLRLGQGAEQMQLREVIVPYVQNMFTAAKTAGYDLSLSSGYRSYELQKQFYDSYVLKDGQQQADAFSARPGFSEHQTGLAFDVEPADKRCELQQCFGDTPEGMWLAQHAHEYGFVVRYPKNMTAITGYDYEPWHLRYVGLMVAAQVYDKRTTLEEYFKLPPAPSYGSSTIQ